MKYIFRLVCLLTALLFLGFGGLIAYEWLVPWYCDAFDLECTYDSLYQTNGKILPNPLVKKN